MYEWIAPAGWVLGGGGGTEEGRGSRREGRGTFVRLTGRTQREKRQKNSAENGPGPGNGSPFRTDRAMSADGEREDRKGGNGHGEERKSVVRNERRGIDRRKKNGGEGDEGGESGSNNSARLSRHGTG